MITLTKFGRLVLAHNEEGKRLAGVTSIILHWSPRGGVTAKLIVDSLKAYPLHANEVYYTQAQIDAQTILIERICIDPRTPCRKQHLPFQAGSQILPRPRPIPNLPRRSSCAMQQAYKQDSIPPRPPETADSMKTPSKPGASKGEKTGKPTQRHKRRTRSS